MPHIDPFNSARIVVQSIAYKALVFGEMEVRGLMARKVPETNEVVFSLQDCGILMDADLATIVINRYWEGYA